MTYDLSNPLDQQRFKARANALYAKGAAVELTEKAQRTHSQNAYLHLVIGVVAMETGNTLEFTKQEYYKRLVNPDIFVEVKQDKILGSVQVLRSSASLSKADMSKSIDRFVQWGRENGMVIPSPEDEFLLHQIEIEMGRQSNWL